MRIGFDAKRAFHNKRGLGNYSRDLIRILSNEFPENEYVLFNPRETKTPLLECPPGCIQITPSSPLDKKFPSFWRTFQIPKSYKQLELDIFHGLSNEIPFSLKGSKTHTVLTLHDLIFIKYPQLYPLTDRILYKSKYLNSCKRADSIIAISHQTKNDLIELTDIDPQKISVIHQGCNPLFHITPTADQKKVVQKKYGLPENYILNVGAIEERKNQRKIVEAMQHSNIDIPLVLVGRPVGNALQELMQVISACKMEKQVLILTDVPTLDLPAIYSLSSLFVYPSLYEGFGIPLLEALTIGVPVISSNGSCLEEAGGSGSVYIDPTDAEALGHSIKTILSDDMKRNVMIESGFEHAANFSDQRIATKIMAVYASLVG